MRDITLKDLLEAGCHFGHRSNRWHPKAQNYIYTETDGVHVIDLVKTKEGLVRAGEYLLGLAKNGGNIIFVGTKRQAQPIVSALAQKVTETAGGKSGFYYLSERWPGGLLTNFDVIKKNNLDAIVRLEGDIAASAFVTKKERVLAQRKLDRYRKVFGGLVGLEKIPEAIFLVDIKRDAGAVREALRCGATVVAIVDTNVDSTLAQYAIPANDDASGSIKIITEYLGEAWIEGRKEHNKDSKDSDPVTQ